MFIRDFNACVGHAYESKTPEDIRKWLHAGMKLVADNLDVYHAFARSSLHEDPIVRIAKAWHELAGDAEQVERCLDLPCRDKTPSAHFFLGRALARSNVYGPDNTEPVYSAIAAAEGFAETSGEWADCAIRWLDCGQEGHVWRCLAHAEEACKNAGDVSQCASVHIRLHTRNLEVFRRYAYEADRLVEDTIEDITSCVLSLAWVRSEAASARTLQLMSRAEQLCKTADDWERCAETWQMLSAETYTDHVIYCMEKFDELVATNAEGCVQSAAKWAHLRALPISLKKTMSDRVAQVFCRRYKNAIARAEKAGLKTGDWLRLLSWAGNNLEGSEPIEIRRNAEAVAKSAGDKKGCEYFRGIYSKTEDAEPPVGTR